MSCNDFVNLFTISIAFNLAFVIKEDPRGFQRFIGIYCTSRIGKVTKFLKSKLKQYNHVDEITKYEFYIKNHPDLKAPSFYTFFGKSNKLIKKAERYIHKIKKIEYMYSACLLLGLYGVLILFIIPLLTQDTETKWIFFFFNMDIVCLLFLIYCIFWDYYFKSKRIRRYKTKNLEFAPRRMIAVKVFTYIVFVFFIYIFISPKESPRFLLIIDMAFLIFFTLRSYFNNFLLKGMKFIISKQFILKLITYKSTIRLSDFQKFVILIIISVFLYLYLYPDYYNNLDKKILLRLDKILYVTTFTCFSSFCIYFIIIVVRVRYIQSKLKGRFSSLMNKTNFKQIFNIIKSPNFKEFTSSKIDKNKFSTP